MLKPIVALIAALVAQCPDAPGKRLIPRDSILEYFARYLTPGS